MYQPNPNIEQDKESAKQVAQACRDDGWLFASHTWGHNKVGDSGSYERFESGFPFVGSRGKAASW